LQKSEIVIPAEAGIQSFQEFLDPRFRGGDTLLSFAIALMDQIKEERHFKQVRLTVTFS